MLGHSEVTSTSAMESKHELPSHGGRHHVFISHRGTDKRTVAFPLMALFGVFCHEYFAFFDQTSIGIGESNKKALGDAIAASDTCLAILGPDFFTSKWCVWEVEQFLSRPPHTKHLSVIPLFAGLGPGDCRTLTAEACADKSGKPLSIEEVAERQRLAKQLGDCSGYSQGEEQTIKAFVSDVMLTFLRVGIPTKDKGVCIPALSPEFAQEENLLEKIEFVYDKAVVYFDAASGIFNAGLFREFVSGTKRTLLGIQTGHIYSPSKVQAHLAHHYQSKAVFRLGGENRPVDEQTFTHLALIKEKSGEEKKQEAEAMRKKPEADDKVSRDDEGEGEKPQKDGLYWQMSQLDEILKPKTDIDLLDIFNGTLEQKASGKDNQNTNQNILLLGAPGCGKTMFSLRVMGGFAKTSAEAKSDALVEVLHQRYDWVFCLPLRTLSAADCELNYAEIFYRKGLLPEEAMLGNADKRLDALNALLNIQGRQRNPRVLLLLDGFDELSEDLKEKVLQRVIKNSPFQVILTSRPWGLLESVKLQFGYHLETLGFSENQVKEYIARYPFAENPEAARVQLQQLFAKPLRMRALMHIPICLDLICQLAQGAEDLQNLDMLQTATQLYQRIVYHLLKHNAQRPLGSQEKHLDIATIHDFFIRLAFQTMVQDEKGEFLSRPAILFERSRAEALLRNQFHLSENKEEAQASALWRETMHENNPLLRFSGEDCYFMHLTVQEYLAACGLLKNLEHPSTCELAVAFILKQRSNPQYRRMFLYVAGLAKDFPTLLNRFFALLLQPPHSVGRVYETCLLIDALEECGISERLSLRTSLLDYIEQTIIYFYEHQETDQQKNAFEQITNAFSEVPRVVQNTQLIPKFLIFAKGGVLNYKATQFLVKVASLTIHIDQVLDVMFEKTRSENQLARQAAVVALKTLASSQPKRRNEIFSILLEKVKKDENLDISEADLEEICALAHSMPQYLEVFTVLLDKIKTKNRGHKAFNTLAFRLSWTCIFDICNIFFEKFSNKNIRLTQNEHEPVKNFVFYIFELYTSEMLKYVLEKIESENEQTCQIALECLTDLIQYIPDFVNICIHMDPTNFDNNVPIINEIASLERKNKELLKISDILFLRMNDQKENIRKVAEKTLIVLLSRCRNLHLELLFVEKAFDLLLKKSEEGLDEIHIKAFVTLAPHLCKARVLSGLAVIFRKGMVLRPGSELGEIVRKALVNFLHVIRKDFVDSVLNFLFEKIQKIQKEEESIYLAFKAFNALVSRIPLEDTSSKLNSLILVLCMDTMGKNIYDYQALNELVTALVAKIPEADLLKMFNKLNRDIDIYLQLSKKGIFIFGLLPLRMQAITETLHNLASCISIQDAVGVFKFLREKIENSNLPRRQIAGKIACDTLAALTCRIPEYYIIEVFNFLLRFRYEKEQGIHQNVCKVFVALAPRIRIMSFIPLFNFLLEKKEFSLDVNQIFAALCIPDQHVFEIFNHLLEPKDDWDINQASHYACTVLIPRILKLPMQEYNLNIQKVLNLLLTVTKNKNQEARQNVYKAIGNLAPCIIEQRFFELFTFFFHRFVKEDDSKVQIAVDETFTDICRAFISIAQHIPQDRILGLLDHVVFEKVKDNNIRVRGGTCKVIAALAIHIPEIRITEVLDCLLELISDKEVQVRCEAIAALAAFASRISKTFIVKILDSLLENKRDREWKECSNICVTLSVLAKDVPTERIVDVFNYMIEKNWDEYLENAKQENKQPFMFFHPRDEFITYKALALIPLIPTAQIIMVLNLLLNKIKNKGTILLNTAFSELISCLPKTQISNAVNTLFTKVRDQNMEVRGVALEGLSALTPYASAIDRRKIEQVLYGKLPSFPVLSVKVATYVGGSPLHFFPSSPGTRAGNIVSEIAREPKTASLIIALRVYIDTKNQTANPTKIEIMRIQAAEYLIHELKQGRALSEIVLDEGLKEKIGTDKLCDLLRAHEPELAVSTGCSVM